MSAIYIRISRTRSGFAIQMEGIENITAVAGSKPGRCRGQRNKYNQSYIEFREVV